MWIFVAGLSELLFSDPWVGQMEEGDQEARVGKQLGLQRGCGLAVPGRRLTSVRAPTPPSLQRAAMEEVVIAGMSGKLPESENLEEFWANLIGGVDMVTDDDRRWKAGKWAWGSPPT